MRVAQMIYHDEPAGWWAASPDLPGYSAAGSSYDEVRELAREGAPWFAEQELELHHLVLPEPRVTVSASVGTRGSFAVELPSRRRPAFAIERSGLHV
jgi:predicted RNase H-like HicB family nuclease